MAHNLPIGIPVDAECECCRTVVELRLESVYDRVHCPKCAAHQGDTLSIQKLRERDHLDTWQRWVDAWHGYYQNQRMEADQKHAVRVDELGATIQGLRAEITSLKAAVLDQFQHVPEDTVRQWLVTEEVSEVEARLEGSHRFTGVLWRVIWRLDQLHNEEGSDPRVCSCGVGRSECRELQALRDVQARLYEWEHRETLRLRDGLNHGLPNEHPQVLRLEPWRNQQGA